MSYPLPTANVKSVARDMEVTTNSCQSPTNGTAKVNFRFPGVKIFSPSSQPGETTYGKFVEQKGPLSFLGALDLIVVCRLSLLAVCGASLVVEHRL